MSSFVENSAASETQEHPAQNSMELPYGGVDGSDIYAPPPTTMLPPNSSQPVPDTMDEAPYQPEDFSSGGIADKQFEPEGFTSGGNDVDVVNPTVVIEQNNDTALTNNNNNSGEVIKRKRGRPRKYPLADGSRVPISSPPQSGGVSEAIVAVQGSSGKRGRGRPPGSRGKHKAAATFPVSPAVSGSAGVGFTPHVVTVTAGEDVLARLMSFSQLNTQAVCILSANGTISNVTLQQPSSSGGTVTYEGRFEILSLSGSFLLVESNGQRSRTGGLSVSLAGPDGRVLGGGVAGLLTAASPVQIIVGTFMGAGQQVTRLGSNEGFTAPPKLVSGASVGGSPPSRGTLSESSGGPGSPLNYNTGGCDNSNQQTIPNVTWM